MAVTDDDGLFAFRESIRELDTAIRLLRGEIRQPPPKFDLSSPPAGNSAGWTFETYNTYVTQRFIDLSLQLQQRFEAQQTSVATAMIAAEKAVNAALVAAEKAVDKSEGAQALRNQVSNEFRSSLADLSALMWNREAGISALAAVRRELEGLITNVGDRVNALQTVADRTSGKHEGVSASAAMVIAVIGLLIALGVGIIGYSHNPPSTVVSPAVIPITPK